MSINIIIGYYIFSIYDQISTKIYKQNTLNFTVKYWQQFCQQNPVKIQLLQVSIKNHYKFYSLM